MPVSPPRVEVVEAAVYLRVSLDLTGDHLAIDRQREDCLAILRARGWHLAAEFLDNSISASDARKHRPGYNAMVEAYHAGAFSALVCWDLDRLTRQPRQLEDWIDAAEERGLRLVTANGEADLTTDGGRLFARVKLAVARQEIERKSARQKRAARQRAELGLAPIGRRLTGYTTRGELVPDEADIVREIFARFVAGESLGGLVTWLADQGVVTPLGAAWGRATLRRVLLNPRYAGHATYHGALTGSSGKWEPIIDDLTHRLVKARLEASAAGHNFGSDRKHLGSGLYVCDACGRRVRSTSGARGIGTYRYACSDRHCSRSGPPIDQYVIAFVRARLAQPDVADLLPSSTSEVTRTLTDQIESLTGRLRLLEQDYDAGYTDGRRYAAARERTLRELETAQLRLNGLTRRDGLASLLGTASPAEAFDAASLMVTRAVVDELLEVRLRKTQRGNPHFDRASVVLTWRDGSGG